MDSKRKSIVLMLLFVFQLFHLGNLSKIHANWGVPDWIDNTGFFPVCATTNVSMKKADVLLDIDASNAREQFIFSLSANHTFYNPENQENMTIVFPFDHFPEDLTKTNLNIQLERDGTSLDFLIMDMTDYYSRYDIVTSF